MTHWQYGILWAVSAPATRTVQAWIDALGDALVTWTFLSCGMDALGKMQQNARRRICVREGAVLHCVGTGSPASFCGALHRNLQPSAQLSPDIPPHISSHSSVLPKARRIPQCFHKVYERRSRPPLPEAGQHARLMKHFPCRSLEFSASEPAQGFEQASHE